jgi:hypothetical protein
MIVNKEIQLYQNVSKQLKLRKVWDLVKMTPHSGQEPIVQCFDEEDYVNYFVATLGRRSGKSASTAVTALRELLIPYSNTILLTPSYRNSKILFDEVYKYILQLKLPVKSINKNQFIIELENGSKFGSFTESNIESSLGSRLSLLIVDESQSITGLTEMLNQHLFPMMLDYGVKDNGSLYAKAVFLGTPRGVGTEFHNLYLKEKVNQNWRSFNSPSTCNPLLPRKYIEDQKNILPDHVYRQEILAEWITTGSGVFFAFNEDYNLYDPKLLEFTDGSMYVIGLDFGYSDSTAALLVYVDNAGNYFVHDVYQKNMLPTAKHVENFRKLENKNRGKLKERYGDPSAAQLILDLRSDHDYDVQKATNKLDASIALLNELFAPQGMNKKPKLYINRELAELIRQIRLITYKDKVSKRSNDPFNKDPERTHWDLIAALRYAVYTDHRRGLAGIAIV